MNYDFSTGEELLALTKQYGITISEVMIRREVERSERTREDITAEMERDLDVMRRAVLVGIEDKQSSVTGFTGGDALSAYRFAARSYMGERMCKAVAAALAVVEVNSSMGQIVAAPTAGASGIIPGALYCAQLYGDITREQMVKSLFCAGAVGMIIAINATTAGSEGGCQAETGVAAAMGAAALVELKNGSAQKALNAAAIALKNVMGLVCDPIAGLVECPCIKRNAIGVTNAILCADLSLAGVESIIPFDEVVSAMMSVGRAMSPDLRETAKGGLAATPTGKELMRRMRKADEDEK